MSPNLPPRIILVIGIWLWIATTKGPAPLLTLAAILLHEGGHILAARICAISTDGFLVDSLGARLFLSESIPSYRKEILICAAGPLANLTAALFCFPWRHTEIGSFFLSVSLALALLNLLPIKGFDGGRIGVCLLAMHTNPETAERITLLLSFFCLFFLWCISVYQMIRVGADLSLFLFSLSIFVRIFLQNRTP